VLLGALAALHIARQGYAFGGCPPGILSAPAVRHVRADGSYASAQDPRILVGLGDSTPVSRVRVFWPDGPAEDFPGMSLNAYTTLVQGTGRPAGRAAR
jgi:hypothetical protein